VIPPLLCLAPGANAATLRDLLRLIGAASPQGNILASPWDIGRAVGLLASGAAGATRAELEGLGLPGPEALPAAGTGINLRQGSFLWSAPEQPFAPAFLAIAQGRGATLATSAPNAAPALVNGWVERLTAGLLREALRDAPQPGGFVMVTALLFEGSWAVPFDPARTASAPFRMASGRELPVPMMHVVGRFAAGAVPGGMAAVLPYSVPGFAMRLVLPDAALGVDGWLAEATPQRLEALRMPLPMAQASISLPRLNLRGTVDLVPVLRSLGAPAAFNPAVADFTPLAGRRGPFVSAMRHQVALEVTERGTRAAAATTMEMPGMGRSAPPVELVFDRPFILFIEVPGDGPALFTGIIKNPSGVPA